MSEYDEKNINWKQHGIGFGIFLFILNTFVIPYFSDQEVTTESILYMIPICTLAGFAFGRFKKWQAERNN